MNGHRLLHNVWYRAALEYYFRLFHANLSQCALPKLLRINTVHLECKQKKNITKTKNEAVQGIIISIYRYKIHSQFIGIVQAFEKLPITSWMGVFIVNVNVVTNSQWWCFPCETKNSDNLLFLCPSTIFLGWVDDTNKIRDGWPCSVL